MSPPAPSLCECELSRKRPVSFLCFPSGRFFGHIPSSAALPFKGDMPVDDPFLLDGVDVWVSVLQPDSDS